MYPSAAPKEVTVILDQIELPYTYDQIRELEQFLTFAPHEARHRLVIINEAAQLNDSAANALLKSVEEPRPRTLFVLTTAAVHRVKPTLLSRCQKIRFS